MATATGHGGPPGGAGGSRVSARGLGLHGADGWIVREVALTAASEELVAVVGPAGSGRTSLLLALGGRMRLHEGSADVAGERLPGRYGAVRRRTGMARSYGVGAPDPYDRVGELLDLAGAHTGRRVGERAVREALTAAGLTVVEHLDGGGPGVLARRTRYEHLHPADRLLLAVALALVGGPEVLLVDAVDDGLDDTGCDRVWTELRRIARSGTTVVASASGAKVAARYADRVVPLSRDAEGGHGAHGGPRPGPGTGPDPGPAPGAAR